MEDYKLHMEEMLRPLDLLVYEWKNGNFNEESIVEFEQQLYLIDMQIWDINFNISFPYMYDLTDKILRIFYPHYDPKIKEADWQEEDPWHSSKTIAPDSFHNQIIPHLIKLKSITDKIQDIIQDKPKLSEETTQALPKFKLNLSVAQMAALFELLIQEKILEIPDRKKSEFARTITAVFSSMETENMSAKSFLNKMNEKEPGAMKYWYIKLADMRKKAM